MKGRSILFLIIILIINSCRQELTIYDVENIEQKSNFFENAEDKLNNIKEGEKWLKILKEEDKRRDFVAKLKDTEGIPVWDKVIISTAPENLNLEKSDALNNIISSKQRIIIPLTKDGIFMSSYIVATINENNKITYLENIDNKKLYEIVYNKSISKDIRENIMANIIFINNRAFGFKKFINVPSDLFSDIPLDSTKTTKTIKLVEDDSDKNISPNSMLELMCLVYETDDPNCSCHGTITSTKCFYIYVGGGASSGGGDGDGSGDGGKPGSGDSGGSGISNNTPWYLMNPNINIYSYSTFPRAVFKEMTDYGIVLQKEHMDYMQSHPDVTNSILENLENNNGYKAVFFYNFLREIWYKDPKPNSNILINKFNSFYGKLFEINPTTTWFDFQNIFLPYEDTNHSIISELFNDWNNPNIVKPTLKFKNNIKLNSIYNQAKTATNFQQYLKKFIPDASVAHLMFDVSSVSNSNHLAETEPPSNYWIKIIFNKDKDWANIPKIVILDTFLHEMIHAEIYRKLLSLGSTHGNIDINKITSDLLHHNYPGLFDYYVRYTKDDAAAQHNMMAKHYVEIMVNFLKQVYGNKYSDIEYKTVVWMGLKDTRAWNLLPKSDRDLYETTWNKNYWLWEK
ncbi:hypothetical protein [Riemerella columbina]|uniref:hypothetical protein n=1 Tax=Riemerella columbina TaxID=103810 RepID=UPI00036E1EAB|nr:hypothetical protein [Riemerella columbina]